MANPPLVLLDGASMWFRSFFGLPSSIRAPDGRQVNAVRGFIDSMATVIAQQHPARLAVCLDLDWRPQWRVALIPSYKAHRVAAHASGSATGVGVSTDRAADTDTRTDTGTRTDTEEIPADLTPQVAMILDFLGAFGIATAGAVGFEADDVMGTLAARESTDPVVVVSGDRDLLQVVSDDPVPVRVLYIGQGLAKATLFGPGEVAEKYGLPRERAGAAYAELATLRGDPSDGLPGVPGIGDKTASTLLTRYGSLAAIMSASMDPDPTMTASVRAKIVAGQGYIESATRVVLVDTEAPVRLSTPSDRLPGNAADADRVTELAASLGISSSLSRLQKALGSR